MADTLATPGTDLDDVSLHQLCATLTDNPEIEIAVVTIYVTSGKPHTANAFSAPVPWDGERLAMSGVARYRGGPASRQVPCLR